MGVVEEFFQVRVPVGVGIQHAIAGNSWDESTPDVAPDQFLVGNLMGRLASLARDPWNKIDAIQQKLPALDR
jgi:DNA primase